MENDKKKYVWLSPSVIIQVCVWVFMLAFYVSNVGAHIANPDVHMSYQMKVREFVPRNEFEALKKQLDRIEKHTESLEAYIRSQK